MIQRIHSAQVNKTIPRPLEYSALALRIHITPHTSYRRFCCLISSMACVENAIQRDTREPMALLRNSLRRMSNNASAQIITFPFHESQPASPKTSRHPKYHGASSFMKRCSQLATRRQSLIEPSYPRTKLPTIIQWTQTLPSSPFDYEDFLESQLEEAVGQLVCGPNAAAEECELEYNYDALADAPPETCLHVQAQQVVIQGRQWIAASITSTEAEGGNAPEVLAYGKWILTRTRR